MFTQIGNQRSVRLTHSAGLQSRYKNRKPMVTAGRLFLSLTLTLFLQLSHHAAVLSTMICILLIGDATLSSWLRTFV